MALAFNVVNVLVLIGVLLFVFRLDRRTRTSQQILSNILEELEEGLSQVTDSLRNSLEELEGDSGELQVLPIPPTEIPANSQASVFLRCERTMFVNQVEFPAKDQGTFFCRLEFVKLRRHVTGEERASQEAEKVFERPAEDSLTKIFGVLPALPIWGPMQLSVRLFPGDELELGFSNPDTVSHVVRGSVSGIARVNTEAH